MLEDSEERKEFSGEDWALSTRKTDVVIQAN